MYDGHSICPSSTGCIGMEHGLGPLYRSLCIDTYSQCFQRKPRRWGGSIQSPECLLLGRLWWVWIQWGRSHDANSAARGKPTARMTSAKLEQAYAPWADESAADAGCAFEGGAPNARTAVTTKMWRRITLTA